MQIWQPSESKVYWCDVQYVAKNVFILYVPVLLITTQRIYTQNVLEIFFAEDCLGADATFKDETLKIVKFI